MNFFSPETKSPMVGKRIKLLFMDDTDPIPVGSEGVVTRVTIAGYEIKWDCGRTLSIIPELDRWEEVEQN